METTMARRKEKNSRGTAFAKAIMQQYQPKTAEDMQEAMKDIFGPLFESML